MASIFSLPLAPSQQPPGFRASLYKSSKKRKREEKEEEEEEREKDPNSQAEASEAESSQDAAGRNISSTAAVLSPEDEHQYRVAGQPFDEDLPGGHFPHAPVTANSTDEGGKAKGSRLRSELAALRPPLYASHESLAAVTFVDDSQLGVGVRLRHLAVVNAILHRCLLQGDFIRAGRAWGMLLRSEVHGRPIDLRARGFWGIGAEILMRQESQMAYQRETSKPDVPGSDANNGPDRDFHPDVVFSKEGFDKARMYYERLILQYPYRRTSPHSVSSLDFYAAMFGLWIYSIQEEYRIAKTKLGNGSEASGSDDEQMYDVDEHEPHSPSYKARREALRQYERREELRKSELRQAELVTARLDELVLSPPYSDSHQLLRIRGMMALWIGDLGVVGLPTPREGNDLRFESVGSMDQDINSTQLRDDHARSLEKKRDETERARLIFTRLADEGATIPHEVGHLLPPETEDLRDLA
ncbi:hypothetical protein MMC16_003916 [Acarospora aff. strigata]|nr:hypothetical protein [Acarospora aff. strigata]